MGKLNAFLRAGCSVLLEDLPFAGKVFEILHEMDNEKQFSYLKKVVLAQVGDLREVWLAVNNLAARVTDMATTVRTLNEYNQNKGLVMLPKLLQEDEAFKDFWLTPENFGGKKERLSEATKQANSFSFLLSDMSGEKWIYHLPVYTFGMMLSRKEKKGEPDSKVLGYDELSQTHWITGEDGEIYVPERSVENNVPLVIHSNPVRIEYSEGIYVGYLKEGNPHGQGALTFPNGIKYEGEWQDGKYHGQGTCVYLDKTKYEGEWQDGKMHGQGTCVYPDKTKYEGEWQDGKWHGQGTLTYSDGRIYKGQWQEDEIHGKGTMTYPDGSKYEGQWQKDEKNGQGIFETPDGEKYEGEWKNNQRHGQGTMTYSEGCEYKGKWKDNKRHGWGTMVYPDGSRYEGEWSEKKKHGQGTLYNSAGEPHQKGLWENDNFIEIENELDGYIKIPRRRIRPR